MSDQPQPKGRRWVLPVLPLLVLTGLYVAGYFVLGEHTPFTDGYTREVEHVREFRYPIIQAAYYPMGWLESSIRGESVELWNSGDDLETYTFEVGE